MTSYGQEGLAQTATGASAPTLALNMGLPRDYQTGMRLIDIMQESRAWRTSRDADGNQLTFEDLRDGGYLDDAGWVTEIPDGVDAVTTLWQWSSVPQLAEDHIGTYVLEYEGSGTIELAGDATVISSEPGRIVFENTEGANFYLKITETDPSDTGDYLRGITIVAEEDVALYEAGARFNPDWLELVQDASQLRFMNWQATNNSEIVSWDERTLEGGLIGEDGMSIEIMVKLANEAGVDPWFCMPHMADEEYIREFATYVRDNLDPELQVRVEYSNETWNFAFQQTKWLAQMAQSEWGDFDGGGSIARLGYTAMMATQTALIWEEVFGDEADARLVNVLGSQAGNPWVTEQLLEATAWREMDPDGFIEPSAVFEEVAITNYFGSATVSQEELRAELLDMIADPDVDAMAYLAEKLMDPDYQGSIPAMQALWQQTADVAHDYGLGMTAYEGGQHVHHSFAIRDLTDAQLDVLTDFMIDFVRSDAMGDLYAAAWEAWAEVSDGPFMQFGDVARPTKWGSWGLYSDLNDSTSRSDLLEELSRTSERWWDAEGGSQYQQGLISEGTEEGDILSGTTQEDYLIGHGGNDVFIGGAGNDGINGGDGIDRVRLSGSASDYTVVAEGDGYRVDGPDGSDFLIHVEQLSFDDGSSFTIEDMAAATAAREEGNLQIDDVSPIGGGRERVTGYQAAETTQMHVDMDGAHGLFDAHGLEAIVLGTDTVEGRGLMIDAVRDSMALGRDLGLTDQDSSPTYAVYEIGAQAEVNGETLDANFWTVHANSMGQGDIRDVADSALDAALLFGSVVTNAASVIASDANDVFSGRDMNDVVYGMDGKDALIGRGGNDFLDGGDDNDRINGGTGDDVIIGGAGDDHLTGGAGSDRFSFDAGSGHDVIYDFAREDLLDLGTFLDEGQSIADAASLYDGNLMISNGEDEIVFAGLDMGQVDWIIG